MDKIESLTSTIENIRRPFNGAHIFAVDAMIAQIDRDEKAAAEKAGKEGSAMESSDTESVIDGNW